MFNKMFSPNKKEHDKYIPIKDLIDSMKNSFGKDITICHFTENRIRAIEILYQDLICTTPYIQSNEELQLTDEIKDKLTKMLKSMPQGIEDLRKNI